MVMFRLEASLPQFSYALHSLDDLAIFKVGIPYCSKAATTSHFSPVKETKPIPCNRNQYFVALICGRNNTSLVTCVSSVQEAIRDFKHSSGEFFACPDQVCMKQGSNFSNSQCAIIGTVPSPPFSECSIPGGYAWCAPAKDIVNETLISFQSVLECIQHTTIPIISSCTRERGSYLIFIVDQESTQAVMAISLGAGLGTFVLISFVIFCYLRNLNKSSCTTYQAPPYQDPNSSSTTYQFDQAPPYQDPNSSSTTYRFDQAPPYQDPKPLEPVDNNYQATIILH